VTHRHRTRRRTPDEHVDAARELLAEVRLAHRPCCTCCLICRSCGHPCQQVRLAEALRQAIKHAR
jgi:hypothetical protein